MKKIERRKSEGRGQKKKHFSEICFNCEVNQINGYDNVIKTAIVDANDIIKGKNPKCKSIIIANINANNVNKLINLSSSLRQKFDLIMVNGTSDYNINKKLLEKMDIDVFIPYVESEKDFMHWRNSGINNVLVDILSKRKIALCIDLSFLSFQNCTGDSKCMNNKIKILGRVIQNIRFCNKRNCDFCVTFLPSKLRDFRNAFDVRALLLVLGMKTQNINPALSFFYDRIKYNEKARKKKITDGIWMK